MALHGCDMDCYLYWCLLSFPEAENPSQWQDSGWCQFSPCWCYCNEWCIDDGGCYLFRNCLQELKFTSFWPWIEGFSSCCGQLLFPRLLVHLICILEKMKYGVVHCYNMQSCSFVMNHDWNSPPLASVCSTVSQWFVFPPCSFLKILPHLVLLLKLSCSMLIYVLVNIIICKAEGFSVRIWGWSQALRIDWW